MTACRHTRTGVVTAGTFAHRATAPVCSLSACIAEALSWANRVTRSRTAEYTADVAVTR